MTLTASERKHPLKKHLDDLTVVVAASRRLTIVPYKDLMELIKKNPDVKGLPECVAFFEQALWLYPLPLQDYECQVLGVLYISQ